MRQGLALVRMGYAPLLFRTGGGKSLQMTTGKQSLQRRR